MLFWTNEALSCSKSKLEKTLNTQKGYASYAIPKVFRFN